MTDEVHLQIVDGALAAVRAEATLEATSLRVTLESILPW